MIRMSEEQVVDQPAASDAEADVVDDSSEVPVQGTLVGLATRRPTMGSVTFRNASDRGC